MRCCGLFLITADPSCAARFGMTGDYVWAIRGRRCDRLQDLYYARGIGRPVVPDPGRIGLRLFTVGEKQILRCAQDDW